MNKTISINLGGSVFNIEEDAFLLLKNYLESIKSNFSGDPSSQEIMADIEARIAEIFHEQNSERKNVIVQSDVLSMMSVMGKPEDYRVNDKEESRQGQPSGQSNPRRKIYRDTEDAVIAGVCSGLSHYFHVDPLVIRLLVVILTLASIGFPGVLGYILFWALVPAAVSTTEKLQMRGEHVNVENIGRFVNEEAKSAAERVSRFGKNASNTINQGGGDFFRVLGKIFAVFFGIIFVAMGLGLMAGIFSMLAFSDLNFFGFDGNNWDTMNTVIFGNDGTLWLLITGLVLVMGAPAIALLYGGIKLMTGSNKKIRGIGISLASLFIIGAILCVYGGVKTGRQFSNDAEINNTIIYPDRNSDTLYLEVMPDEVFIGRTRHNNEFTNLVKISGEEIYYGEPINLEFEPTSADQFKVSIRRKSQGSNMDQAGQFARNISHNYVMSNDSLILDPYFRTPVTDRYRGQEIFIVVYVPLHKYVHFGKNVSLISWYKDESGALRMNEDGLEEHEEFHREDVELSIVHPEVKVTDDSVIIRSGDLEIKTRRD